MTNFKKYVGEGSLKIICSECHCESSFSVHLTNQNLNLKCCECETDYSLHWLDLTIDPYDTVDDTGLLIEIKKTG